MVQHKTLSSPLSPSPSPSPSHHSHNEEKVQQPPARFKGVRYRSWGRWVSEIRLPRSRERVWLGSFATAEMASRAFEAASIALHGSPSSPDHGHRRRRRRLPRAAATGPQPGSGTPAQHRLFKDKIRAIASAAAAAASIKPGGASLSNLPPQFYTEPTTYSRNSPTIDVVVVDDDDDDDDDEDDSDTRVSMWNHHWAMNRSPGSEESSSDSYFTDSSSSQGDSPVQNEWAGLELELDGWTWNLEQEISVSQRRKGWNLWEADLQILQELEQDLASNSI